MSDVTAQQTADGSYTLYSERYAQTFHSDKGALTESQHVFLHGAGVVARAEAHKPTMVIEVGFGTGLNYLLSADLFVKRQVELRYWGLEHTPLPPTTITTLGFEAHINPKLLNAYLNWLAAPTTPFNYQQTELHLKLGNATTQPLPKAQAHAIYLDAFSPEANPELWTEPFLARLYDALVSGGVLTTYSVKSEVRRLLQAIGFKVEKRPGPPAGKREMLWACKSGSEKLY